MELNALFQGAGVSLYSLTGFNLILFFCVVLVVKP